MITNLRGDPFPPQPIVKLLRRIDPRLGLVWMQPGHYFPKGTWSVTYKWHPNDKRYQLIQQGKMQPWADYDSIAYLPDDCSVEQAKGYVQKAFVRWSGKKDDARRVLANLNAENEAVQHNVEQPVMEYAEELLRTNAKTLFREEGKTVPKVFVTDKGTTGKKGVEL